MDQAATGNKLKMSSTLGVIFAFTSDIAIETVAEKIKELNEKFDPRLWPDFFVLLDVGTLNYAIQSPGGELSGDLMPREEVFAIAPFYVNLVLRRTAISLLTGFSLRYCRICNFSHIGLQYLNSTLLWLERAKTLLASVLINTIAINIFSQ